MLSSGCFRGISTLEVVEEETTVLKDFKEFALKGNLIDMATGISRLLGAKPGSTEKPKQVKALVLPRAAKQDKEASEEKAAPEETSGEETPAAGTSAEGADSTSE